MPDMLLPLGGCNLDFRVPLEPEYHSTQKAGALWIDLFVPESAQKGRYQGEIHVKANGCEKIFTVRLKVYACMVPYESRIVADLNNYADNISPSYPYLASNPDPLPRWQLSGRGATILHPWRENTAASFRTLITSIPVNRWNPSRRN